MQAKKVEVRCDDCGWVQFFRPQQELTIEKDYRTECNRCGKSFDVWSNLKKDARKHDKQVDRDNGVPEFHKYTRKSNNKG